MAMTKKDKKNVRSLAIRYESFQEHVTSMYKLSEAYYDMDSPAERFTADAEQAANSVIVWGDLTRTMDDDLETELLDMTVYNAQIWAAKRLLQQVAVNRRTCAEYEANIPA
jgi:5-bromo-4-chloroindolyl phosphate hydrolysis protein